LYLLPCHSGSKVDAVLLIVCANVVSLMLGAMLAAGFVAVLRELASPRGRGVSTVVGRIDGAGC
jgi:hypothetical protein